MALIYLKFNSRRAIARQLRITLWSKTNTSIALGDTTVTETHCFQVTVDRDTSSLRVNYRTLWRITTRIIL